MFGIWIDNGNPTAWDNFKAETNNFGILTWEFEELATSVNFLDLTISIEKQNIYKNIPERLEPLPIHHASVKPSTENDEVDHLQSHEKLQPTKHKLQ